MRWLTYPVAGVLFILATGVVWVTNIGKPRHGK